MSAQPNKKQKTQEEMEGILLGIGNPLLDISTEADQALLDKYDLKLANAILAEDKHVPLYKEIVDNYKVDYIAGGATQNSIRAAQWMLQVPKATRYIGCIGNDAFGKKLREKAEEDGVTPLYRVDKDAATGTCAVLVKDKERALCANLAAANNYKKEDHFDTKEIQDAVQKANFFYSAGFFLTVSPETVKEIGKHVVENNKQFLFNLSATFLIDFFWDDKMEVVLKYADVVFGNEDESAHLGKKMGWGTDLKEVAKKLENYPKENKKRPRLVVITHGAEPTIVCYEGKITEYKPIKLEKEQIVDTNGAGDSFVGGFLSAYVKERPIEECIAAGHYCACECVQRSGATYPPKPEFKYP